jgi:tetratricopeptide (TPR) repeat protein
LPNPQDFYQIQSNLSLIFDRIGITQEIGNDLSLEEFSPQEQDQLALLIEKFESSFNEFRHKSEEIREVLDQRLIIRLGNFYFHRGDIAQALDYYDFSNQIEENEWGYFNSGKILQSQSELDNAFERFEEAIKLKPDFPQALRHQAEILKHQGKEDAALKKLQKSQQLNPNDFETNKMLADYFLEQGEKKEALIHLKAIHHRDKNITEKITELENKKSVFNRVMNRFRKK